jgi:hypothetical protein
MMTLDKLQQLLLADAEERKRQYRQELDGLSLPPADADTLYSHFCERVDAQVAATMKSVQDIVTEFTEVVGKISAASETGGTDKVRALIAALVEGRDLDQ